jgi:hypothetical protein
MEKKAETQQEWMRRVVENHERIEKLQPQFAEMEEYPEWVHDLWLIVMRVSHPKLH